MSGRAWALFLVLAQFGSIIGVLITGPVWHLPRSAWSALVTAIALVVWAALSLGRANATVMPLPKKQNNLVTAGPYKLVRHPMYVAVLVGAGAFAWGAPTPMRWVWTMLLVVVLLVKIRSEEHALLEKHGPVAMGRLPRWRLVPGLW